ncbi:MAG: hypothetical protein ACPGTG_02105 [Flavobacteriales bacterium]
MNTKQSLLFLTLFSLISCSKLPTYHCLNKSQIDFSEPTYSGYNARFGFRWMLFQEADTFSLWIDSDLPLSQKKILYSGFKLYFDAEGKKNKTHYVHFPFATERTFTMKDFDSSFKNDHFSVSKNKGLDADIQKINKEMEVVLGDKTENLNYLYDQADINIKLEHQDGRLMYKLQIPMSKFGLTGLSKFSLGIESGALDFDVPDDLKDPGGMPRNTAMPNVNGTRGNPVTGTGPTGQQRQLSTFNQIEEPIRFWMEINLNQL